MQILNKIINKTFKSFFYRYSIVVFLISLLNLLSFDSQLNLSFFYYLYLSVSLIAFLINIEKIIEVKFKADEAINSKINLFKSFLFNQNKKIFYFGSFLNIFAHLFFFFIILISAYGNPMSLNDRIVNFRPEEEIKLDEKVIKQEFTANSNNLGSVGLDFKTENSEDIDQQDPLQVLFKIRESDQKKYLYENIYNFHNSSEKNSFLFGFPIQNHSKNKTYIFELSAVNNGAAKINLYLDRNLESKINYYPRYVYSLKSIETSAGDIINNSIIKIGKILSNKKIVFYLIINFITIEFVLTSFIIININSIHKHKVYLTNFISFLSSTAILVFGNLAKIPKIENNKYFILLITFYTGLIVIFKAKDFASKKIASLPSKKPNYFLIFTVLGVLFFLTRFNMIKTSVWQDESFQIFAAEGILKNGIPKINNIIVENTVYTRGITQTYLIALFFSVFGTTDFVARIPTLLFSLVSVFFIFKIMEKMCGIKIAILSSLIFVFWGWAIFFSSWSRFYVFIAIFSVILGYVLLKYEETNNEKYLLSAFGVILLATLTNQSGAMLAAFLLPFSRDILKNKKIIFLSILSGLFAIIFIAKKDNMTQEVLFKSNFINEFFSLDIKFNFFTWILDWFPLLLIFSTIHSLRIFAGAQGRFSKTRKSFSYFFIAYLAFLIIFKVPSPQPRIIIPLSYVLFIQTILFSCDLIEIARNIFKIDKNKIKNIETIVFIFIMILLNLYSTYLAIFPKYGSYIPDYFRFSLSERFLPDYRGAALYVKEKAMDDDFVIIDGEPHLFYLKNRANLFLNKNKKTSIEDLQKIQKDHERVWIVSGYMQPGQHTNSKYKDVYDYLEQNAEIVFVGNFPSKVYLLQ